MPTIATSVQSYSNVVKQEFLPESGYCKRMVTYNGTATTIGLGTVLGTYIDTPVATAGATVGTGNGVMGAITVTSNANLQLGVYRLFITRTVANAGDFVLLNPQGLVVGNGQVGIAFNQAGFSFTLADGATDFVVGTSIPITVTGTVKAKLTETTATDGTEVPKLVVVGDSAGRPVNVTTTANTDTRFLVIYRGPVAVADASLTFGATVTAGAVRTAYLNTLATLCNIDVLNQI